MDGLHTFSQTLRDFLASQAMAHNKTVWLIDDTFPSDPVAAEPDLQRVKTHEKPNLKLVALDSYCPHLSYFNLEGHGQTIVLPIPRKHQVKTFYQLTRFQG